MKPLPISLLSLLAASLALQAQTLKRTVSSNQDLQEALKAARPGSRIDIAPGTYSGGL